MTEEEVSKEAEGITPRVLLNTMNGEELMETSVTQEDNNADEVEERSPLKKNPDQASPQQRENPPASRLLHQIQRLQLQ
jgi:hypothetical protein